MRVEEINLNKVRTLIGTFSGLDDFANVRKSKFASYRNEHLRDIRWAGGTLNDFYKYAENGDMSYARRSEAWVDKFTNLAIEDVAVDMGYNLVNGVLDYNAAVSGNPECMYGATYTETEKSPVAVYIDNWVQCTVPQKHVQRRGVAVLALVRALSMFRPVSCYLVGAGGYRPDGVSWIQIVPVPTAPMNLSKAAWMLGSPMMTRIGQFGVMHAIVKNSKYCSIPPMLQGRDWQRTQLGKWFAKREELSHDTVFLPLMDNDVDWATEKKAVEWVKTTLAGVLKTA